MSPAPPHYTSVPPWARAPQVQPADPGGRTHSVIEVVAPGTAAVVDDWVSALTDAEVRRHTCSDAAAAAWALEVDLESARAGHRVLVAGTAEACLAVRAAGVRAGMADDEIRVGVVSTDSRSIWCVHCSSTTSARVDLDEVVDCAGCERGLVVYPHISRRTGQHLGFMVDAELPSLEGGAA